MSSQIISVMVAWLVLTPQLGFAQGTTANSGNAQKVVEILATKVLIVDSDKQPIEDATVTYKSMRGLNKGDGRWVTWQEDKLGPAPRIATDKHGIALVPYPKFADSELATVTLNLKVEHADYVNLLETRDVVNPADIILERGFRVAISAIDATTKEKIKSDLYALISGSKPENWNLFENGMLVSPNFSSRPRPMRVMRISSGKPNLYSSNFDVAPGNDSRVLMKNVKLSLGTRIEGKIDESVPRPIRNGHVAAVIVRVFDSRLPELVQKWTWTDDAKINEDGTFVFESLPPGEILQMIAICDGYVSKQPLKSSVMEHYPNDVDRLKGNRTMPHLAPLSGDKVAATIMMEKATSLRVLAQTPDDQPLSGVEIVMIPNQEWFRYGTSVLGSAIPTETILVANRNGKKNPEYKNPFTSITNAEGVAVVSNLPPNRLESLRATHKRFELPLSDSGHRTTNVKIVEGETNEVTIKMQNKETETSANQNE